MPITAVGEVHYRLLFEYSPDGLLIADPDSYYLDANPSICRMLGYSRDEIIGKHASDIVAPRELRPAEQTQPETTRRDQPQQRLLKCRDGSVFAAEVIAVQMPDGNQLGIIRNSGGAGASEPSLDTALIQAREREISRLSRLYSALSQVNLALVHLSTRDGLLQKICRVLVEHGGFSVAWVGWYDPDLRQLVAKAAWGDQRDYAHRIRLAVDDTPAGCSPTALAFRSGQPYICNDVRGDPNTLPWRDDLIERHHHALAAFPIAENGKISGALTVLADRESFFNKKEIELLQEAAFNISFGLDNLLREQERMRVDALAKNERQFSDTMIESMPGILYFYDLHGKFLRWNRNFEVVSGYTGEEIARMHPLDFFSAQEQPAVAERIAEAFARGDSSVEASFLAKDGRATPYFFTGRKVLFNDIECLVGMGIDVAQHKQAEMLVAESERKYRELVEHANSIILRWNSEGKVIFLNEFGQRYFGYGAEEIIGRHVIGTIVPLSDQDGHDLQSLMARICANPAAFEKNVNQNMRRNGERVWIAWTNKVVSDAQGNIVEILSIGSDITEQRHAEETIRELNVNLERRVIERTEELKAALVRAEAADRIKSAFLATMSHELRTPLNSIIGFTGILLQELAGPLNPEQSKQLGMVRSSARHLLELINDVLDISKIEAGQLEVRAEPFDLRESIERVVALVKPLAEKKGLSLEKAVTTEREILIGDRRRVEQILINLINNAIKFTERGRVTLTVEEIDHFHSPGASSNLPAVAFRIEDTGVGIKPEHLGVLFQPFHQIDTGLSRQHEGTGLGLAICRRLAALMGGEITVRSEWQKGSEFTVTLPWRTAGGES